MNYTSLAGAVVGAATGAVFTPFGIPFGAFAGAVLGLLSGCWTAAVIEREGPGLTLGAARLRLTTPPLVVLTVADTIAGFLLGSEHLWVPVVIFAVAATLSVTVTLLAAPWVVTLVRPDPAGGDARYPAVRTLLAPLLFLPAAVVAWGIVILRW